MSLDLEMRSEEWVWRKAQRVLDAITPRNPVVRQSVPQDRQPNHTTCMAHTLIFYNIYNVPLDSIFHFVGFSVRRHELADDEIEF